MDIDNKPCSLDLLRKNAVLVFIMPSFSVKKYTKQLLLANLLSLPARWCRFTNPAPRLL